MDGGCRSALRTLSGPSESRAVRDPAAIAALHCEASNADEPYLQQIVGIYALLVRLQPFSVIELDRTDAFMMADGSERGLELDEGIRTHTSRSTVALSSTRRESTFYTESGEHAKPRTSTDPRASSHMTVESGPF